MLKLNGGLGTADRPQFQGAMCRFCAREMDGICTSRHCTVYRLILDFKRNCHARFGVRAEAHVETEAGEVGELADGTPVLITPTTTITLEYESFDGSARTTVL